MTSPELVMLIFASGKVNFVGVKDRNDAFQALQKVYPLLKKYKVNFMKKKEVKEETEFNYMENTKSE